MASLPNFNFFVLTGRNCKSLGRSHSPRPAYEGRAGEARRGGQRQGTRNHRQIGFACSVVAFSQRPRQQPACCCERTAE